MPPIQQTVTFEQAVQLGLDFHNSGKLAEAESIYRQILQADPNRAEALHLLGVLLFMTGRPQGAADLVRKSLTMSPANPQGHNNLGNMLLLDGETDSAIECYHRAIALLPDYVDATNNLGKAYQSAHRFGEAEASLRRAIQLSPEFAGAHHNLGMLLILQGKFEEGWREHEWRLLRHDYSGTIRRLAQPRWDGSSLEGKTILLYSEQGLGDAIQFVRYIPMLVERGAKVLVETPAELIRLMVGSPIGRLATFVAQFNPPALPHFDVYSPLMSLPHLLGKPDPAEVRGEIIQADSELSGRFAGPCDSVKQIGLAWAGNPRHQNDRHRSLPFSTVAPLLDQDARFFSLQFGRRDSESLPQKLTDRTARIADFAETAGLIANLDLVISADTAVAHLSAAMGKPTWLLLPYNNDFRWGAEGESTGWYRSMRLFRQSKQGNWAEVIERIADELKKFNSV